MQALQALDRAPLRRILDEAPLCETLLVHSDHITGDCFLVGQTRFHRTGGQTTTL
jgi:hypothetical protein